MEYKVLKFREHLAQLVLAGEKDLTWRLFDDKNISVGDHVDMINWNTGEKFGEADVVDVWEKPMGKLEEKDFDGHEKFTSQEEMYQTYKTYYGDRVGPDTIVKVIRFKLR